MFVGLHVMLAGATKTPELAIAEEEGEAFMGAAGRVMRHYSVEATQRTLDWIAFAGCAGGIYGPRAVAIALRRREEGRSRPGKVVRPAQWNRPPGPPPGPAMGPSDLEGEAVIIPNAEEFPAE
jgi:hypothetical protein